MFDYLKSKLGRTVKMSWGTTNGSTSTGYDAVSSRGDGRRRAHTIELVGEDSILTADKRHRLINLTREGMRNAPQVRTIVQQLRVMIVGLQGGKLTMTTDDPDWNKAAQDAFGDIAASVDFVDGTGLNDCLKLLVTALAAEGGDFAALFDSGELTGGTGSGKVRFFESDTIGNMSGPAFAKRFPGFTQRQGLIYDRAGRMVGIIVSGKKRGQTEYKEDECFSLTRNPDTPWHDSPWYFGKRKWRLEQGRGVSPQSVAIAALLDMYEIVQSEVGCSKLNAKVFAQVIDSMGMGDGTDGSEVVPDAGATDAEIAQIAQAETTAEEASLDVGEFEANAGGHVLNMPYGYKMDLLDTKRPNNNLLAFAEWLNGGAAAVHGMARVYSGLKAESSYTAFRGEQCISQPSIEEGQKELERGFLDWYFVNAIRWAISVGRLAPGPIGWERKGLWQWPNMREVNELDAQNALTAKLKNFATTYQVVLGPNWQEILTQAAQEVQFFTKNGLIHPATQTVSGQVVTTTTTPKTKEEESTR